MYSRVKRRRHPVKSAAPPRTPDSTGAQAHLSGRSAQSKSRTEVGGITSALTGFGTQVSNLFGPSCAEP